MLVRRCWTILYYWILTIYYDFDFGFGVVEAIYNMYDRVTAVPTLLDVPEENGCKCVPQSWQKIKVNCLAWQKAPDFVIGFEQTALCCTVHHCANSRGIDFEKQLKPGAYQN